MTSLTYSYQKPLSKLNRLNKIYKHKRRKTSNSIYACIEPLFVYSSILLGEQIEHCNLFDLLITQKPEC